MHPPSLADHPQPGDQPGSVDVDRPLIIEVVAFHAQRHVFLFGYLAPSRSFFPTSLIPLPLAISGGQSGTSEFYLAYKRVNA